MDRLLVGKFLHMPAAGEWTLGVLDRAADGRNGTLVQWSLEAKMKPCDLASTLRCAEHTRASDAPTAP